MIRPMIDDAMEVANPAAIERRVLTLTDPDRARHRSTTTNLSTAFQILLPGQKARPHRHTMNALRFVVEGKGAAPPSSTARIARWRKAIWSLTPGWTWHEHVHRGDKPIIWLDALDDWHHGCISGTDKFEPAPAHDLPAMTADRRVRIPEYRPRARRSGSTPFSPVFRYPWAQASGRRCAAAPTWKDGARRVRYINPITGGPTMPLMDCYLDPDRQGHRDRPLPHHQQRRVPGVRRPRHHQGRRGHDRLGEAATCSACRTATGSPQADETVDTVPGHRPRRAAPARSAQGAIRKRVLV